MKKTLFIFVITIIAFGCKKKNETALTPGTPTYYFVKNWKADTLRNGALSLHTTDSFYAFKDGDTSGVYYHGVKLYAFVTKNDSTLAAFTPTYFSPVPFDTSASYSTGYLYPYKYYHTGDATYKYQKQSITITKRYPHFDTTGDAWYWGKY